MLKTYNFAVNLKCGACPNNIKILLQTTDLPIVSEPRTKIMGDPNADTGLTPGITTVIVDVADDIQAAQIEKKIQQELNDYLREEELFKKYPWLHWVFGGVGVISGLAIMALMILMPLGIVVVPAAAMLALGVFSAVLSLVLGGPTIYQSVEKLLKRQPLDMGASFALSGTAAIIITILHLFVPGVPMMFDLALMLFGIQHLGDAIKASLSKSVIRELSVKESALLKVTVEGMTEQVPLENVAKGNVIHIPRNSLIPIDGILQDDEAELYTTLLDGNTMPVLYKKDQDIKAGWRVPIDSTQDFIRVKTTGTAEESTLHQLYLKSLTVNKHPLNIINFSNRILRYYFPIAMGLAILSSIAIGILFTPSLAIIAGLVVLAVTCSCSQGIVTPLAEKLGINKVEQQRVVFNKPDALQIASQIDTVIFDWNGTATAGKPEVLQFTAFTDNKNDILSAVCELENRSSHPIARAICRYGAAKNIATGTKSINDIKRIHAGITAMVDGQRLVVGNEEMMLRQGIDASTLSIKKNAGQHITYIALDNKIKGYFILENPPRKGLKATFDYLRILGIKQIGVLSGDDDNVVQPYKDKYGLDFAQGNCKVISTKEHEKTKVDFIEALQQDGHCVAMIGDAGNDFMALNRSDLGIVIQSPASDPETTQCAHVVIEGETLFPVIAIFEAAKQTTENIKQNVYLSLSSNILMFAAAITVTLVAGAVVASVASLTFVPVIAAALMIALFGIVVANTYRKQPSLELTEQAKEQYPDTADYSTTLLKREMRDTSPQPLSVTADIYSTNFKNEGGNCCSPGTRRLDESRDAMMTPGDQRPDQSTSPRI